MPFCSAHVPPLVGAQIFPYTPGALSKVLLGASMHAAIHVSGSHAWYMPVTMVHGVLQSVATLCSICQRSSNLREGAGEPRCPLTSCELAVLSHVLPYIIKTVLSWAVATRTLHRHLLVL